VRSLDIGGHIGVRPGGEKMSEYLPPVLSNQPDSGTGEVYLVIPKAELTT